MALSDNDLRSLLSRVEQTRRAHTMSPPHSAVAVEREHWLDLAGLAIEVARRQLAPDRPAAA